MAFRSAAIGIISILSTLAPAGVPVAMAHHDGGYGYENYNEYGGYYSNTQPQWENPYYAPQTYRTVRNAVRRTGNNAQNGSMPGFRCYYKGKDGSCMNYSYIHGPQWGQWNDAIYPPVVDPFVARPYGYDYERNYGYEDYDGYYDDDRWDDDDCYYADCEW
jgi:hypothetical protein